MGETEQNNNSLFVHANGTSGQGTQNLYLTFMLGDGLFALSIVSIREIIDYGNLAETLQLPEFVRGVVKLHGAGIPVIDLSVRCFDMPKTEVFQSSCIVIVEIRHQNVQQVVGLMVDAVDEVLDISTGEIYPSTDTDINASFISGMGKVAGKFVIILNVNEILSPDDFTLLEMAANVNA
jgi:purine-binding chemotaxis protein CheW